MVKEMGEHPHALMLSDDDLARFRREGYVVVPSAFDAGEIEAMQREAQRVLELVLESSVRLADRSPRLDAGVQGGQVHVRKIQPLSDVSPFFADVASDERLLGPLRQVMGDEPILMEEKLNFKQAIDPSFGDLSSIGLSEADDGFDLHTDWGYFVYHGYPPETLSSAISIDASAGRGPLRVVPGSHLVEYPVRQHGIGVLAVDIDDAEKVDIEAPPGSVMVFHSKLVHDSTPNRSGLPRRLLIYSHFPASHPGEPDRRNAPLREAAQGFERRALAR